jgi:hypothetical protein
MQLFIKQREFRGSLPPPPPSCYWDQCTTCVGLSKSPLYVHRHPCLEHPTYIISVCHYLDTLCALSLFHFSPALGCWVVGLLGWVQASLEKRVAEVVREQSSPHTSLPSTPSGGMRLVGNNLHTPSTGVYYCYHHCLCSNGHAWVVFLGSCYFPKRCVSKFCFRLFRFRFRYFALLSLVVLRIQSSKAGEGTYIQNEHTKITRLILTK